ncbi:39S ribosomal protein L50, mitochondrial-like [Asterias rubens]|uniref:39S ribosomal protein L50, mitochondrial-like n=1 Tax=Asterias rubens TaxID=7604 RepID=UPI0014550C48|nr:39S ribosomal protein L50, mitochondrial-like [Asterias rubens]
MAAHIRRCLPRIARLSSLFNVIVHRQVSTSSILAIDNLRSTEQSWVKKILKGSGPSQDVEDELMEEEIVEIEPQYMDIIHTPKATFIDRPKTRKRVYNPPEDLMEKLQAVTLEVLPDKAEGDWTEVDLKDNLIKYQILSKCHTVFKHDVPSFLLSKMRTMDDVVAFYQTEVKDTTVFSDMSNVELPPNLKIHWDYKDDSVLELYQEHLDYVKPRERQRPPEWKFKPSSGT